MSVLTGSIGFSVLNSPNSGLPDEYTGIYRVSDRVIGDDTITVTYPAFPSISDPYITRSASDVTVEIDKQLYLQESNTDEEFYPQLQRVTGSTWIDSLRDQLVPEDTVNEISSVARFVQQFEYEEDIESTGVVDYTRHPVELIVDGVGDCDCRTTFLYSMLDSLGYTAGFVFLPYHVGVIVPSAELTEKEHSLTTAEGKLTLDGVEYTYIEPNEIVHPGRHSIDKENIIIYETVDTRLSVVNPAKVTDQIEKSFSEFRDAYGL